MDDGELRLFQSTFASVDAPEPAASGPCCAIPGPGCSERSFVQLTGNILRGTCSFANGAATVKLAKHNVETAAATPAACCKRCAVHEQPREHVPHRHPLDPLANNGGRP
jgi:hypothetical protein